MQYMNLKEASQKWDMKEEEIQTLCEKGEIPDVCRLCWGWAIPVDAKKPEED